MEIVLKLLAILALSTFELWVAVPAGLAMQLHPAAAGTAAALGAMLGTLVVVLLGDRVRRWRKRPAGGGDGKNTNPTMTRIWRSYGVIGLGLLAPWITGAPLGAAVGLVLGAPADRLFFWICVGAVLCTAVLTVVSALGFAGLETLAS